MIPRKSLSETAGVGDTSDSMSSPNVMQGTDAPAMDNILGQNRKSSLEIADGRGVGDSILRSKWPATSSRAYHINEGASFDTTDSRSNPTYVQDDLSQPEKTTRKYSWNRCAVVTICIALLLCVAAGIALAVVLTSAPIQGDPETIDVQGQITLKDKWSEALANKSSQEYQDKVTAIKTELDRAFKARKINSIYEDVKITRLSPGSIVVDFLVQLKQPSGDISFKNGAVVVKLEDGSVTEVTSLIKDAITAEVNMDMDDDMTMVKVSIPVEITPRVQTATSKLPTAVVPCRENTFRCGNGACIPREWVCDSRSDCSDNSDENPDTCAENRTTTFTEVANTSTTQIPKTTQATSETSPPQNGTMTTTSDRLRTTTSFTGNPTIPRCQTDEFHCGDDRCVPVEFRCDGTALCHGGEDEIGCVQPSGNRIHVNTNGKVRPLCSGPSMADNQKVAKSVCTSMGFARLESVSVVGSEKISLGVIFYQSPDYIGYMGNFQPIVSIDCSPLDIKCVDEVTNCGLSTVPLAANYIQHGHDAVPGQWPWQIQLLRSGRHHCGGTLLDERWVLTATHCVDGHSIGSFRVVLGTHSRSDVETTEVSRSVVKIINHPFFVDGRLVLKNDISLLLLNESVRFTDFIKPACMPQEPLNSRRTCYLTGWGRTESGDTPDILQQIRVSVMVGTVCNQFRNDPDILDSMVCATKYTSVSPACYGDSGGPMSCLNSAGRWEVHGVASFGPPGCRDSGQSSNIIVYTNVHYFQDWIKQYTACRFRCSDGTCLYDNLEVCNGVEDCEDGTDEGDVCAPSVTCTFEFDNICGYTPLNLTILNNRRDELHWLHADGEDAPKRNSSSTDGGRIMITPYFAPSLNPLFDLRSPNLTASNNASCLRFQFYIWPGLRRHTGAILQVLAVDTNGTEQLVWGVDVEFGRNWNLATASLPAVTHFVVFRAQHRVAIDDVELVENQACPPIACVGKSEMACNSPSFCLNSHTLCDSVVQCEDATSYDEDPKYCGASVDCDFEDDYSCGFNSAPLGLRWKRIAIISSKIDWGHTTFYDHVMALRAQEFSPQTVEPSDFPLSGNLLLPDVNVEGDEFCLEFSFILYNNPRYIDDRATNAHTLSLVSYYGDRETSLWTRVGNYGERWHLAQVALGQGHHNLSLVYRISSLNESNIPDSFIIGVQVQVDDFRLVKGKCQPSVISCSLGEFQCAEGHCIPWSSFCDGIANCEDRKDEPEGCLKEGSVRLVGGGPHSGQGRVEMLHQQIWGPICGEGWGWREAFTVCRSLGLDRYSTQAFTSPYGEPVWGPLRCDGHENSLASCEGFATRTPVGCHNVGGVSCGRYRNDTYSVWLGSITGEAWKGGVTITYGGRRGSVCRSGWDEAAANVTCRMLGYRGAVTPLQSEDLSGVTGVLEPWLSGLRCTGNETYLHECEHDPWYNATCDPSQTVAVECIRNTVPDAIPPVSQVALANGTDSSGRVEVFYDGQWGTMCDDYVTNVTVNSICRYFGYTHGNLMSSPMPGSGPIWLDDVRCLDESDSFLNCSHNLGFHDCNHYEDVSVECRTECESNQTLCADGKTCVLSDFLCDGDLDCPSGDDEASCVPSCASGNFVCQDLTCLSAHRQCDGIPDCENDEDERNCVRLSSTFHVEILRDSEWRPLCAPDGHAGALADAVCRISSHGPAANVSTQQVSGRAWIASPYSANMTNATTLPGYSLEESRDCWSLLATCQYADCGMGRPRALAIDGSPTPLIGDWPWHVRIWSEESISGPMCEGVLVDDVWVLTTSSCSDQLSIPLTVGGGAWDEEHGFDWQSNVRNIVNQDPRTVSPRDSALTLLSLSGHGVDRANRSAVCLPFTDDTASRHCYLVSQQPNTKELQETRVYTATPESCAESKANLGQRPDDSTECIVYKNAIFSQTIPSCYRDRGVGSPIVCQHPSGRWVLDSMSWRPSYCASNYTEDVVTSVRHNMEWIARNTECPFQCADRCLDDLDRVCDGKTDCPGSDDEGSVCGSGVTCSFDFFSNCGYSGGQGEGYRWVKVRKVNDADVLEDHSRGTPLGGYFTIREGSRPGGQTPDGALLTSPELMTSSGAICIVFHFVSQASPTTELEVVALGTMTNTSLLRLGGEYDSWRRALVEINSTLARPLRLGFIARNITSTSVIGVDDIQIWENCTLACEREEFRCGNSVCIDRSFVCDDFIHCPDGADEINCTGRVSCDFETSTCGYRNGSMSAPPSGWQWSYETLIPFDGPYFDHTTKRKIKLSRRQPRVRLVNGAKTGTYFTGRVEVVYDGVWGTVCDDGFGYSDALVVCRMLGYRGGTSQCCANYGRGTGPIWLTYLRCLGREEDIMHCSHDGWGRTYGCHHGEDVGVHCTDPIDSFSVGSERVGVRLVNGQKNLTSVSGRVEVFHEGVWGTVCDDSFDDRDALVFCRMLGYRTGKDEGSSKFGRGSGTIWLDEVGCLGTEDDIVDCYHRAWGSNDCSHSEDVGISCSGLIAAQPSTKPSVKNETGSFIYTTGSHESLLTPAFVNMEPMCLEFYYFIFPNQTNRSDAFVVTSLSPGRDAEIWRVRGDQGAEWRLVQIPVPLGRQQFEFRNNWNASVALDDVRLIPRECDVSVVPCDILEYRCKNATVCISQHFLCDGNTNCPDGDDEENCSSAHLSGSVRLVASKTNSSVSQFSGVLELFTDGEWRPISFGGRTLTPTALHVICRQLGFSTDISRQPSWRSIRTQSYTNTWMISSVFCLGSEKTILDCVNTYPDRSDSNVEIHCPWVDPTSTLTNYIRLAGGAKPSEGRLEVKGGNQWGTVCDDNFGVEEASAACRTLGYRGKSEIISTVQPGTGPIWLDDISCAIFHPTIFQCVTVQFGVHDCTHYEDVSLKCVQDCGTGFSVCQDELTCVNDQWICDGEQDCPGGDDETGCNECSADQFVCKNYDCIPGNWRCDGVRDCQDGSDEFRCLHLNNNNTVRIQTSDGVWKTLCAASGVLTQVAANTCDYLGYKAVKRVSLSPSHTPGVLPTPSTAERALINGFKLSLSESCDPIVLECESLECGVQGYEEIDGIDVSTKRSEVGEWPWLVLVNTGNNSNSPVYIGALLNENWVLAPYYGRDIGSNSTVRLGVENRQERGLHEVEREVIKTVTSDDNYLMLLLLSSPVIFTPYVRPVCLPTTFDSTLSDCFSVGWMLQQQDFQSRYDFGRFPQKLPMGIVAMGKCFDSLHYYNQNLFRNYIANDVNQTSTLWGRFYCSHSQPDSGNLHSDCVPQDDRLMVCRDNSDHWQILGFPSEFIPRNCSYKIYSSVSSSRDWIEETTACPFSCGSTCLYNVGRICDGIPDCPLGEDEGAVCERAVDCTFTYSNICGYENAGESVSVWVRASYDIFRKEYKDAYNWHAWVDQDNTTYGTYLMVYNHFAGVSPAIVESPMLVEPRTHTRCLTFRLSIKITAFPEQETRFAVVGMKDGQGVELLNLKVERAYVWEDISLIVPDGTQRLRFIGTKPVDCFMAVDDIHLSAGNCWTSACAEDEFKCSSGSCVKSSSVCDNTNDCVDGSDEENCDTSVSCDFETPFLCGYKNVSVSANWSWGRFSASKDPTDHVLRVTGRTFQLAVILSPSFIVEDESCVYFRYMVVDNREQPADWSKVLEVLSVSDQQKPWLVWRFWSQSAGSWRLGQIQLRSQTGATLYRLIFTSDRSLYGTVYLDDIKVTRGACNRNVTACGSREFLCNTGDCIQARYVCDSNNHCPDGSDENRDCSEPLHPIRLVGGGYPSQGRVEILIAGRWGAICSSRFDRTEAQVACRMLNHSMSATVISTEALGIGPPYLAAGFVCSGSENRLERCAVDGGGWIRPYCYSAAGVICVRHYGLDFMENNVRLLGENGWEGLLEIYHDGEWGTVCNVDWDLNDAMVVCRMMGYGPGAEILSNHSRRSSGKIWMSNVNCRGDENRLDDCRFSGWDSNRCHHTQDVGVRCLGGPGVAQETAPRPPSERIRLADGAAPNEGRVEVQFGQVWGTVCDDFVTQREVNVTCKTLGYSGGGEKLADNFPGSGQIWLDDLECFERHGANSSIFSCHNSGIGFHNCDHLEDLAVRCYQD